MRSSCASTTVVCWAVSIWKQWSGETQPVRRCSTAWPASSRNGLSGTRRWDGDFSGFNLISGILPEAKYLKSGQNLIFINRFLLFCGCNQVKNLIFINGFLLFCGYNQVKTLEKKTKKKTDLYQWISPILWLHSSWEWRDGIESH